MLLLLKSFTLSRSDKGPDSEFSIEPEELAQLRKSTKNAWLSLGEEGFYRDSVESQSKLLRRSIYFIKDKKAGEIVTKNDIKRIRPGHGLSPKYEEKIIGKKLKIKFIKENLQVGKFFHINERNKNF